MKGDAPPRVERLDFSTETPGDFGACHDIDAPGSTVSRLEGPFRAAVTGFRFPGMPLVTRHLAGVARVRLDGFDHVDVQVLRRSVIAAGRHGDTLDGRLAARSATLTRDFLARAAGAGDRRGWSDLWSDVL